MSVILLTLPLLWAQVNPATPGSAPTPAPAAAQAGAPAAGQAGAPATKGAAAPDGGTNAQAAGAAARSPALPPINPRLAVALAWIYFTGDPTVASYDLLGATITWIKAISLICLVGWLFSWMITGIKERMVGLGEWF